MQRHPYHSKHWSSGSNPLAQIKHFSASEDSEKLIEECMGQDLSIETQRLNQIVSMLVPMIDAKQVCGVKPVSSKYPFRGVFTEIRLTRTGLDRLNKNPKLLQLSQSSAISIEVRALSKLNVEIYFLQGYQEYQFLPRIRFLKDSIVYFNGADRNQVSLFEVSDLVIAIIWVWPGVFERNINTQLDFHSGLLNIKGDIMSSQDEMKEEMTKKIESIEDNMTKKIEKIEENTKEMKTELRNEMRANFDEIKSMLQQLNQGKIEFR